MVHVMWRVQKHLAFILLVGSDPHWNLFFIFLFLLRSCPFLMLIGIHRMPLLIPGFQIYHYLCWDLCLPFIDLLGPLHWISKWQTVTAASSAEAEIYATDECVKFLLELVQILDFLDVCHLFMPTTNIIYNDNKPCVEWSKRTTTKGLWHIQMRENRIWENIASQFFSIHHIDGKINLADIFTKEMKDISHFVELRDLFMCHCLWTCLILHLVIFLFEGSLADCHHLLS